MTKKFLIFTALCLCCVGILGCFGWTCYIAVNDGKTIVGDSSAWVPAVGQVIVAIVMAPWMKRAADELME